MHIHALITARICAIRALTRNREPPKGQLKMTWWRYALGVLLNAALLGGCADGGQTGQPTAASSCQEPVALDAVIDGVSGQQLIDAFAGTYSATVHWQADAFAPPDGELTLQIAPTGNEAAREGSSYPCYRLLRVPVAASLTFADGSEVGSGNAMLSAPYGSFAATLSFNDGPWLVDAELSRTAGHEHIDGDLKRDGDAGLTSGLFSGDRTTGGGVQ